MRERKYKETLPAADLSLIDRVLGFASLRVVESQQQVYDWFIGHPYVPDLQRLPESDGTGPFINDQRRVKAALDAIAKRDSHAIDRVRDQVLSVLGRTFSAQLRLQWHRGNFRIVPEPVLISVEACLWYAVALIFHHELQRLVKSCKAVIDGDECGRFFLFAPRLRRYCSQEHAAIAMGQARSAASSRWQKKHPKKERIGGGRSRSKSSGRKPRRTKSGRRKQKE